MSISSAQRTRLGIFIVIAVVSAVLVLAAGIGIKLSEKRAVYYSEFTGESLSGLTKGMEVKFRGIPIGKVTLISYDPKDLSRVKVSLEVEKSFPMKADMIVQTGMVGITGLKYIEIMGGTNDAKLLPEGSVIPSKSSLMAELTVRMESILGKVETLLENLNTVTNPDSLKDVQVTLHNVAELTGNINKIVDQSSTRLDTMTTTLNNTLASANRMVSDLEQGKGPLGQIIYNVDTTIVSIKDLTDNLNLTFTQSREDLGSTMDDLKQTMENVNDLSSMLLENPSLLLRGSPQQNRKIKQR